MVVCKCAGTEINCGHSERQQRNRVIVYGEFLHSGSFQGISPFCSCYRLAFIDLDGGWVAFYLPFTGRKSDPGFYTSSSLTGETRINYWCGRRGGFGDPRAPAEPQLMDSNWFFG